VGGGIPWSSLGDRSLTRAGSVAGLKRSARSGSALWTQIFCVEKRAWRTEVASLLCVRVDLLPTF
jgi:hypothetical protein